MVQIFYLRIFHLFSILTLAHSQQFDMPNSQNNLFNGLPMGANIQSNLDPRVTNHANSMNQMLSDVPGNLQNEVKTKDSHKDNTDEDAKLLIEKIEKLVTQYQKLKQDQDNLQKKVNQLEKIVSSSNESNAKEKSANVHPDASMKQQKVSNNVNSHKTNNFLSDSQNFQQSNNPSENNVNYNEKHDFVNQFQKPKEFRQNNRRMNFPTNPINAAGNFLTGQPQVIQQNPFNDIYNSQNFAQTQNIVGRGVQQLPYYGRRFFENQIQNPLQYQTYLYSK